MFLIYSRSDEGRTERGKCKHEHLQHVGHYKVSDGLSDLEPTSIVFDGVEEVECEHIGRDACGQHQRVCAGELEAGKAGADSSVRGDLQPWRKANDLERGAED